MGDYTSLKWPLLSKYSINVSHYMVVVVVLVVLVVLVIVLLLLMVAMMMIDASAKDLLSQHLSPNPNPVSSRDPCH